MRCGRCSNVFNALANLSEDRQVNAATAASPAPPMQVPRETSESGTPEESPRYEEVAPAPPTRVAPPPQPVPPAQLAPRAPSSQQGAQRPAAPPQNLAPARGQSPQPQASRPAPAPQNSFAPRGTPLPPPTAVDLDDIPDISLEFDATSDISHVFVQQPTRRLVLEQPPPQAPEPEPLFEKEEIDTQLRSLAAQLNTPQPAPQSAAPLKQARAASVTRSNPSTPSKDPGSTGSNPVLRIPQRSTSDRVTVRQVQAAPVPPQQAARQSAPAPAVDPPPMVRQTTGAPVADPPPMVRQSTGAPSREAAPSQRQAAAKPAARAKASRRAAAASRDRKGRSPEELIQAAAEVVKRAGRRRVANGAVEYDEEPEPDVDVVPNISESFPTRIRRRAFQAIETDGAALRARIPSLSWGTAAVALSALFVLQVINHYRNELATSDRLRKPLTSLYRALGVTIVPRWDLGAYEVRQLGALAGAGGSNQLTVRLSVKNGAKSAQPLPYLRVTVQDRFGNRIASRDVPPEVYAPKRAPKTLLDADQRIDAEVAFVDPGQNAVGFEIDACLPTAGGSIACANDQIAR